MSLEFSANALNELTTLQQSYFNDGLNFWQSRISGYQDGVARDWVFSVDTFSEAAQNGSVVLGSAWISQYNVSNYMPNSNFLHDVFIYSGAGSAEFNTHPDAGGLGFNPNTIRHEIGHALGIGTLWEANGLYNDNNPGNNLFLTDGVNNLERVLAGGTPGQYMGASALAAYRDEFDPNANYVPVELDGGPGTANAHWNEVSDHFSLENQAGFDADPGDDSPSPIVATGMNAGESLEDELMSGSLSGSAFLSDTTLKSLEDIGFTVVVPEPAALALVAGIIASLSVRRRLSRRGAIS
ncbi:MAG: Uncharacterised protein [Opitutia bacterium UBA7350]|nr:MAG: Uncharacterised protein [Opitutae bacterium UBA7350]